MLYITDFEFNTGKLIPQHGKARGSKGGKGRIACLGIEFRKLDKTNDICKELFDQDYVLLA